MDCRTWLLLAALMAVGGTGCITQHHNSISDKTTTEIWTPLSVFKKEAKKKPQVETCLKGGDFAEKDSFSARLSAAEKEQKLVQARKAYQQALDEEPSNVQALAGLARVYVHLKDYDKAQAAYDRALKQHPKNSLLWFEQGQCHHKQKLFGKAADAFRKAADADPENRDYAKHLGLALAQAGRTQESVQVLSKLYGEAQGHYKVALILERLDEPDQARQQLQLALQRDPMLQPAHQMLARLNGGAAPPANMGPAGTGVPLPPAFSSDNMPPSPQLPPLPTAKSPAPASLPKSTAATPAHVAGQSAFVAKPVMPAPAPIPNIVNPMVMPGAPIPYSTGASFSESLAPRTASLGFKAE
jgi:Tfp pilus assembly protein PilF